MNILIIEDEQRNANRLMRILGELSPEYKIVGHTTSVVDSIEYFRENTDVSLILADVRLSDGLSFEVFKEVNVSVPVIFTTAYDEYAIQAFKYNSFDYLLKPVVKEELENALKRVKEFAGNNTSDNDLSRLIQYMERTQFKYRCRFLLPYRDGYKIIKVDEIFYIYSELKITKLVLKDGTTEAVPYTLEELEKQLDPELFFRANRQFIIHIDSVDRVGNYFNSKLKLHIKQHPDLEVLVSREKAPLFKAWMDK